MPHLSTTDADEQVFELTRQLNQYEIKRELVRADINHPPDGFTLDWLTDKVLEAKRLTLFIDALKGVLNA